MDLIKLRTKLEKAWSVDTAYNPKKFYDHENPARGQCVVTALVVQDEIGGFIMKGKVKRMGKTETHYWNTAQGFDIDLTWRQYEPGTTVKIEGLVSRTQLLRNTSVKARYERLKNKL